MLPGFLFDGLGLRSDFSVLLYVWFVQGISCTGCLFKCCGRGILFVKTRIFRKIMSSSMTRSLSWVMTVLFGFACAFLCDCSRVFIRVAARRWCGNIDTPTIAC